MLNFELKPTEHSAFSIQHYFVSAGVKIKPPLKNQGRQKLTRYHLVSHCVQCLFGAVTGAPGNGYLSTFRLQDHVPRPSSAPFQLPGLSGRVSARTLLFTAFCGIVRLIIATKSQVCQPLFPAMPRITVSAGNSGHIRRAPSPAATSTRSPGWAPTGSRAVTSAQPQRTWTKRLRSVPGRPRLRKTAPITVPIIIHIPPFDPIVPRFFRSMRMDFPETPDCLAAYNMV